MLFVCVENNTDRIEMKKKREGERDREMKCHCVMITDMIKKMEIHILCRFTSPSVPQLTCTALVSITCTTEPSCQLIRGTLLQCCDSIIRLDTQHK